MFSEKENQSNTFHTKNPVPFILVSEKYKNRKLKSGGVLGNIAPTILEIMEIEKFKVLEINGKPQKLTTREAQLLKLLCINSNEVLDRNFALKTIWNDDNYFNGRSMDVYITKLRKFLKEDPRIEIVNVHGKGFKLLSPAKN